MIRFFDSSKRIALWGSMICTGIAFGLVWLFYHGDIGTKIIVALAAAALCVNVVLYVAKLVAMRKYQEMLLLLYEKPESTLFLEEAAPLLKKKAGFVEWATHAVHVANAYMIQNKEEEALSLLQTLTVPERYPDLKVLVLANTGMVHLRMEESGRAQDIMKQLQRIAANAKCGQKLKKKILHVVAYQKICLGVLAGKQEGKEALEKDYATSKSMVHKANTDFFLQKLG